MNAPSSAAAAIRYISKTIPVLEASTYISILYLQVSIWLCLEVRIVEMVHSNEPILSTWRIRGSCRVHGNSIHRPLSVDVQTSWMLTHVLMGPKCPFTRPTSSSKTLCQNLVSNLPCRSEVVVTFMASCPPPRRTLEWCQPRLIQQRCMETYIRPKWCESSTV